MLQRLSPLVAALLVVGLVLAAVGAAAGDDVGTAHSGEDHSGDDGSSSSSEDGNLLPGPNPVAVLAVVGLAAAGLRRRD